MENDLHLTQHISKRFNQELEEVRNQVMKMGSIVEQQVTDGLQALLNGDSELGQLVIDRDNNVNEMEIEIDETCTEILARRQPAASDLRLLLSIIKTITDLERIGDEAQKLGDNAIKIDRAIDGTRQFVELKNLGNSVINMLKRTLNAYARLDVNEAIDIIHCDRLVNDEFDTLLRLLVIKMMEDPRQIKGALQISWCARALERIGDHSQNICEYIVYLVKGQDVRHISPDEIRNKIE